MIKYTFLLIGFSLSASGQTDVIKGVISDGQSKEILSYANIVVYENEQITSFTASDTYGQYEIIVPPLIDSSCLIKFSFLSYETKTILCDSVKRNPTITLDPLANQIEEIKISSYKRGIIINGDTTTYKPQVFAHGQEKTVKELIEKLPGVQIDESGKIKANGKEVNYLLLEGDDFMNNSRSHLLHGIDAKEVGDIQLIEHYEATNSVFNASKSEDHLALNIELKNDDDKELKGRLEAGYGVIKKYDAVARVHSISRKEKHFISGFTSNTGLNRLGIGDYVSFQGQTVKNREGNSYFLRQIPDVFRNTYQIPYASFKATNIQYNLSLKPSLKQSHQMSTYFYVPEFGEEVQGSVLTGVLHRP